VTSPPPWARTRTLRSPWGAWLRARLRSASVVASASRRSFWSERPLGYSLLGKSGGAGQVAPVLAQVEASTGLTSAARSGLTEVCMALCYLFSMARTDGLLSMGESSGAGGRGARSGRRRAQQGKIKQRDSENGSHGARTRN